MKVIFYITLLTSFLITNLHALPNDLLSKTIGKIKSDKTDKTKYKKFYKYASNFEDYLSLALDPVKIASKNLEEVKSEKVNEYTSNFGEYFFNLIPGKGITEVSVDLRENYKPDYSILITRELKKLDNGNYFMQFSLFSSEVFNDERYTGNLGFGSRRLSDDKTILGGLNFFLDYDDEENARASIGAEIKNAVLQLTSNYYKKIDDGTEFENVLDGYDIQLTSQVPYIHWANIFTSTYKWYGVERNDTEGRKYGSELFLTPSLNLEIAYDDKRIKGFKDEYYARLFYVYPPRTASPTLLTHGLSSRLWKEEKDMSGELISKVKRQNKIVVESNGSVTVSRLD
ncbi:inverse autotransporter beta domain-containing protein [Candidatus Pelagibacter sp.]|nr:inverse autotransporter beta domain-containing protein [Candidatus Pelagibacter sp.]